MNRPAAELLETPGALLSRTRLREFGYERRRGLPTTSPFSSSTPSTGAPVSAKRKPRTPSVRSRGAATGSLRQPPNRLRSRVRGELPPRLTLRSSTDLPVGERDQFERPVSSWAVAGFSMTGGRAAVAALSPPFSGRAPCERMLRGRTIPSPKGEIPRRMAAGAGASGPLHVSTPDSSETVF